MTFVFALLMGLTINIITAAAAYRLHAVTLSGMAAGIFLGTVIFASGGWPFWCVLLAFFASSSLLSVYRKKRKKSAEQLYKKTGARDWVQVFANGGISMICAIGWALTGSMVFAAGFAASLAASNADTWASELGPLSKKDPVLITTFQPVPKGRSGAVSIFGTAAAFAGALCIAAVYALSAYASGAAPGTIGIISAAAVCGGFAGSLADSFLGATLQAQYLCPETHMITEKSELHGIPAELIRGFRVINNDAVNALSGLTATVGVMMFEIILR